MTDLSILFEPFDLGPLQLPNRIVMAPMTRVKSPQQVPDAEVAAYYARRAAGGCGLVISEGTTIKGPGADSYPNIPFFYGPALGGWSEVVDAVHAEGGIFMPQLWHLGMQRPPKHSLNPDEASVGPSGLLLDGREKTHAMTEEEIETAIAGFVQGVVDAKAIGCDGVELHGAHGYLIDQFFWDHTNKRGDDWGGDFGKRARFAAEIIARARVAVGPDFPILIRVSQWKGGGHYDAKGAPTPDDLSAWLAPMAEAGVTGFHASTRRFWEPEFDGSDLNLAGWVKKLTGLPTISVGSAGLDVAYRSGDPEADAPFSITSLEKLAPLLERGDFDLIAVGRAFIPNPDWPNLVKAGAFDQIKPYNKAAENVLY